MWSQMVCDSFPKHVALEGMGLRHHIGGAMKKKEITQAVLAANRANAKKSAGPRTSAGKLIARRNATTHGFFAQELALNDEEKREFETLRRTLHLQLSPETVLQDVAFAGVLSCIGRCKLALRMEMRQVSRALGDGSAQSAHGDRSEVPVCTEWYLSGKQGLREGLGLLEALKQEFLTIGRIDERWNFLIDQAFGPRLRLLLTDWIPSHPDAALLANHLIMHSRTFHQPLPVSEQERNSVADGRSEPKLVLDPDQSKQMVIKLLDLEMAVLCDLRKSSERLASDSERAQNQAVDFTPRYFTTACRDLHRAVAWYTHLRKEKL
jgi:hypothetical protein